MSATEPNLTDLTRDAVAAVDPTDQLTDVLALPEHIRDALWKVDSAGVEAEDTPGGLIVAGMGHSALAGTLARAMMGDHASRPILTARAYGLPPWTTPDTTVLCASYSGETEETLACYEAAGALGARRIVATSGGRLSEQARADGVPVLPIAGGLRTSTAVGYLVVAVLEVAAQCGAGPRLTSELDVAAEHLEELVVKWAPSGPADALPKQLARRVVGTVPVIAGAGLTTPVAARWAGQLNTVARMPSFALELPELDHAELAGWESASEHARFSALFLDDTDTHPRVQARLQLTREVIAEQAAVTEVVRTVGTTAVERVLSLVLLGDLVASYAGVLRGVDPAAPSAVDRLKAELGD